MLKKRIIFTLLYERGSFMLSRNFRLQRVGNLRWLQENYNFANISRFIDELIILDVTRGAKDSMAFREHVKALTNGCFIPIAAGGGVRAIEDAQQLLRSGADKVVINSLLDNPDAVSSLASTFGRQCLVASIDVKLVENRYRVFLENGTIQLSHSLSEWLATVASLPIGEIYLNSINRDGTGDGYLMDLLNYLPPDCSVPVILAGGAGKPSHFAEGLSDTRVSAVATAHLFNFVGNGLALARIDLIKHGFQLPIWSELAPPRNQKILSTSQV